MKLIKIAKTDINEFLNQLAELVLTKVNPTRIEELERKLKLTKLPRWDRKNIESLPNNERCTIQQIKKKAILREKVVIVIWKKNQMKEEKSNTSRDKSKF